MVKLSGTFAVLQQQRSYCKTTNTCLFPSGITAHAIKQQNYTPIVFFTNLGYTPRCFINKTTKTLEGQKVFCP
jgi:hypothetical protein